jgi:hypothetical protein
MSFVFRHIDEENQHLNYNLPIPISFFKTIRATEETEWEHCPASQEWSTWGKWVIALLRMANHPFREKGDAFLYAPTIFSPARRLEQYATLSALLVVDADHGLDFDSALARMREDGLEAVIHTSGSNVRGDKFRIIVPIAMPVASEDQKRAVSAFRRYLYRDPLVKPDTGKLNAYSLFYIPGQYERVRRKDTPEDVVLYEAVSNRIEHLAGTVYGAEEWIEGFPEPEPPPEVRRTWETRPNAELKPDVDWQPEQAPGVQRYRSAGKGGHHTGMMGMINSIAMSAYTRGYDLQVGELAAFAEGEQRAAHPNSPYSSWEIDRMAYNAISDAPCRVPDPVFARVCKNRDFPEYPEWPESRDSLAEQLRQVGECLARERAARAERADNLFCCDPDDEPDGYQPEADEGPAASQPNFTMRDDRREDGPPPPLDIFWSFTPDPVLTRDMLPETIAAFAFDVAERNGISPEAVAMSALAACAGAIHDGIKLQPYRHDTEFTQSARLWVGAIGAPGDRKSDALRVAAKPFEDIDTQWQKDNAERKRDYEKKMDTYRANKRRWDNAPLEGRGAEPVEPDEPPQPRLATKDFTTEGLRDILKVNERGILVRLDELMTMIGGFDAYRASGAHKDRSVMLEIWDGGRQAVDRAGGASVIVPNWSACIMGGIQEEKLAQIAPKLTDDGFLQRFFLYRVRKTGKPLDRMPNRKALDDYMCLANYLAGLTPTPTVTLSTEAHDYREEVFDLVHAMSSMSVLPAVLRTHLSKYTGMWTRLLLTLHVIEHHGKPFWRHEDEFLIVDGETARKARDLLVRFLIPNAFAIYLDYFSDRDEDNRDARWIAGHILAHKVARITERDIYRVRKDLKKDRTGIHRAMGWLVEAGWAERIAGRTDSTAWVITPVVHVLHADRAEQERQQRDEIRRNAANHENTFKRAYA